MIDRAQEKEEASNREVRREQLKKSSREERRDLGLRNECGVKRGGIRGSGERRTK